MRCVADENVPSAIIEALRFAGIEVWSVRENGPGLTDEAVLAVGVDLEAVLLTEDKDLGALVFGQRRVAAGVLLLRLSGMPAETKARLVVEAVRAHQSELRGSFAVLTKDALRIRRR